MVRVLIERQIAADMVQQYETVIREMRKVATNTDGYVSGESMRNVADDRHTVVISTWGSRRAWESWSESAPRQRILVKIRPMLDEPERITVLQPA